MPEEVRLGDGELPRQVQELDGVAGEPGEIPIGRDSCPCEPSVEHLPEQAELVLVEPEAQPLPEQARERMELGPGGPRAFPPASAAATSGGTRRAVLSTSNSARSRSPRAAM